MARVKVNTEKNNNKDFTEEQAASCDIKGYTLENFLSAVMDLSLAVNNAYFKAPFVRCPSCNQGNNAIMAHFGHGGSNKIGNLKGLQASIGDIIAWHSDSFSGISIVKSKDNGVFGLESNHFDKPRKEPAVIERLIVPQKYRPILGKMALYLSNKEKYKNVKLSRIGQGEYPSAIAKEL